MYVTPEGRLYVTTCTKTSPPDQDPACLDFIPLFIYHHHNTTPTRYHTITRRPIWHDVPPASSYRHAIRHHTKDRCTVLSGAQKIKRCRLQHSWRRCTTAWRAAVGMMTSFMHIYSSSIFMYKNKKMPIFFSIRIYDIFDIQARLSVRPAETTARPSLQCLLFFFCQVVSLHI